MENPAWEGRWEKRWNPLRQEWVVYAAHRNNRPWTTSRHVNSAAGKPDYDPSCYLCPGNTRIHGDVNPQYPGVYIFDNDHPVVGLNSPEIAPHLHNEADGLFRRAKARGIARVVCYDPRHNISMTEMETPQVAQVFQAWKGQMEEFSQHPEIDHVLIFENKGELSGVSNPHPHCQIYATDFPFRITQLHREAIEDWKRQKDRNLFADLIEAEMNAEIRIVAENEGAVAFIPFFARYAYEVMIFPKRRHATLVSMGDEELYHLADCFHQVIRKYDLNAGESFPYVMTLNQAPVDGGDHSDYHLHVHLHPPLRQPGLPKMLGGPETGGMTFMADTMPEEKAAELRRIILS